MTVKEVLETKTVSLLFAGYCDCGCGERCFDLVTTTNLAYPPLGENLIKQVRPDLLEAWE